MTDSTSRPVLLLLDGHNIAYRSFFAVPRLTAPDGRPSQALFGFLRALLAMQRHLEPTHWCAVFDGGLPAARLEQLESYKAQRPPMPDELRQQLDAIQAFLAGAEIPLVRIEGQEADDVIACLARSAAGEGAEVRIASNDKDLYALAGPRVRLISPTGADVEQIGPEEVRRRTGVAPDQIQDWLALTGDASDNIPGVPGIGPKTAARLLSQFGTLEALWERLVEVQPERIRARLAESRALVERNRSMMRLRDDLPVPVDWRSCARRPLNPMFLRGFYQEWGFHSLLKDLQEPGLFDR